MPAILIMAFFLLSAKALWRMPYIPLYPPSKGEFNGRIPPLKGGRGMLSFKIRIAAHMLKQ
jgi:hypothetical protein